MNNKLFKIIFCVFFLLIILSGNIFSDDTKYLKLEKDTYYKVQGKNVLFKKGYILIYTKSNNIKFGTLAEKTLLKVHGRDIKFLSISLSENGNIKVGIIKEKTTLKTVDGKSVNVPADYTIELNIKGLLIVYYYSGGG